MQLSANTLDLPLCDVLQVLQRDHRTCLLRLSDGMIDGELFLENGETVHAWFGELTGSDALSALLAAPELDYEVAAASVPVLRTMARPLPERLRAAAQTVESYTLPGPVQGAAVPSRLSLTTRFVERRALGMASVWSGLIVATVVSMMVLWDALALGAERPSDLGATPRAPVVSSPTDARESKVRELRVKGSDTIGGALFPAWARAFEREHPRTHVAVEALGSATAFGGLLDGSASIGASSRLARADELTLAKRLDITLHEIVTGYDGIGVIVHPSNPLRSLELDVVAAIFAGRASHWNDLGGKDLPIHVIGRPSYSGTHGFFKDQVLSRLGKGTPFGAQVENIEASQEIVERVANDPTAIAYVSLGWAKPNVRVLALASAPSSPAIAPEPGHVRRGDYPLSRPLLLYLRGDADPQARALAAFAVSTVGQQLVATHGFVPVGTEVKLPDWSVHKVSPHAGLARLVRVTFPASSAHLDEMAMAKLSELVPDLRKRARAIVIGNADSEGAPHVIVRLSQRRADAVASYLRSLGVDSGAVSVEVGAADHPLATNQTSAGRSENRRADIFVVPR